MRFPFYTYFLLVMTCWFFLSGCEVVGGIFKAGMYWAFFLVALVVGIILWVMMKARRKK
jgi:hypothetical protein